MVLCGMLARQTVHCSSDDARCFLYTETGDWPLATLTWKTMHSRVEHAWRHSYALLDGCYWWWTQIFKEAGLSNPIGGACLVGMINIVGTILSTAVTDHYGRKPLMIVSHAGARMTSMAASGSAPASPAKAKSCAAQPVLAAADPVQIDVAQVWPCHWPPLPFYLGLQVRSI